MNDAHPRERLLVVDDEENLLSFLVDLLEMEGYHIVGANSGRTAMEAVGRQEFHAALLDYNLGDTTGLALAKEIHLVDPEINVILMTAHASLDMAVKAIQADVYDYIVKPIDALHLKNSLKKALDKRRLAIENKQLLADLKKANQELNRLNEIKNCFLSIVSHDLRTPLTSIKGYAQVLDMQTDLPSDQRIKFLHIIMKETEHLGGLINDLMDFVSIEAGKLRIEKKPGHMGEILSDLEARMRPQAEEKKINLHVSATPNLSPLMLDKRRISQVITNLVGNAFKHTPEGGSVTVTAAKNTTGTKVTVQDTGEGIPPQDLPHLFEQFYQGESHTSKKDGIGLGLTICQEIVNAHGGKMEIHSDGVGAGTRVCFTLPLSE